MAAADRIGSLIASKYRLEALLGEGGMGSVWRAAHVTVGKRFAVKVLHAEVSKHPDAKRRFTQEAQAAAKIGHPAILDVYDLGEDGGELYMVMELLEGESLAQRVARGPLPISESLEVAVGVLDALDAAHGANVIHRDIKPANVFVVRGATGRAAVRVLDFGIAKFQETADGAKTSSGTVLGSAYYMAPEQVRADAEIDARADVWAVGATLYELLVGEPAHKAPTQSAVIAKIVMTPAPPVSQRRTDVDPKLDAIVARALRIDRAERFSSAAEMRDAIEIHLLERAPTTISTSPSAAALSALTASATSSPRPRSLVPVALAALLIGVVASLALASRTSTTPVPPSHVEPPAPVSLAAATASVPEPAALTASATSIPMPIPIPSASASASATPHRPPTRPLPCAAGEALTEGHCCVRGFVWRTDHCERDIAVTAPF